MLGVYPVAMDWNVGAVHSDFFLGVSISGLRAPKPFKLGSFRNGAQFGGF